MYISAFLTGGVFFCHFGDTGWPRLLRVTVAAAACHCCDDDRVGTIAGRRSVDRDIGVLHHFAPDRDVVLDLVAEFRRRAADRLEAQFVERRFEVGQLHDLGDLLLQHRDDLGGVPAGATMPMINSDDWFGTPASAKVGICG